MSRKIENFLNKFFHVERKYFASYYYRTSTWFQFMVDGVMGHPPGTQTILEALDSGRWIGISIQIGFMNRGIRMKFYWVGRTLVS